MDGTIGSKRAPPSHHLRGSPIRPSRTVKLSTNHINSCRIPVPFWLWSPFTRYNDQKILRQPTPTTFNPVGTLRALYSIFFLLIHTLDVALTLTRVVVP